MINPSDFLKWLQVYNVPYGSGDSGSVTALDVQNNVFNKALATGVDDAFIVTLSPVVTSLTNGLLVTMLSGSLTNLTTSPTLKINALTPVPIVLWGSNVAPGDIMTNSAYLFIYNAHSNEFELLNPSVSMADTFLTQANSYNYCLDAGASNAYIGTITPFVAADVGDGFPVYMRAVHANTAASTLTLNSVTSPIVMADGTALIANNIIANQLCYFLYNSHYSSWVLVNPYIASLSVLLTPSGNQVISTGNLTLTTGSFIATAGNFLSPLGGFSSGSSAGGIAGNFIGYAPTSGKGTLQLLAVDNASDYDVIIENGSYGQSSIITLPDPASASAAFLLTMSNSNHSLNYQLTATALAASTGNITALAGNSLVADSPTTSKGLLGLTASDNSSNYVINITNASFNQSSVLTIPDPGAATGTFALQTVNKGTFTPTFSFSTPGDLNVSYSGTQLGFYSIIANQVFISFKLKCTPTFTTSSGLLQMGGLPVACTSLSGFLAYGSVVGSSLVFPSGTTSLSLSILAGASNLSIQSSGTGSAIGTFTPSNFLSGTQVVIEGSIVYSI